MFEVYNWEERLSQFTQVQFEDTCHRIDIWCVSYICQRVLTALKWFSEIVNLNLRSWHSEDTLMMESWNNAPLSAIQKTDCLLEIQEPNSVLVNTVAVAERSSLLLLIILCCCFLFKILLFRDWNFRQKTFLPFLVITFKINIVGITDFQNLDLTIMFYFPVMTII